MWVVKWAAAYVGLNPNFAVLLNFKKLFYKTSSPSWCCQLVVDRETRAEKRQNWRRDTATEVTAASCQRRPRLLQSSWKALVEIEKKKLVGIAITLIERQKVQNLCWFYVTLDLWYLYHCNGKWEKISLAFRVTENFVEELFWESKDLTMELSRPGVESKGKNFKIWNQWRYHKMIGIAFEDLAKLCIFWKFWWCV